MNKKGKNKHMYFALPCTQAKHVSTFDQETGLFFKAVFLSIKCILFERKSNLPLSCRMSDELGSNSRALVKSLTA